MDEKEKIERISFCDTFKTIFTIGLVLHHPPTSSGKTKVSIVKPAKMRNVHTFI